jgi:hypothetical protein
MKSFRLLLFPASLCNAGLGKSIRSAGPLARDVHVITHPGRVILIDRPGVVSPKETLAVASTAAAILRQALTPSIRWPGSLSRLSRRWHRPARGVGQSEYPR